MGATDGRIGRRSDNRRQPDDRGARRRQGAASFGRDATGYADVLRPQGRRHAQNQRDTHPQREFSEGQHGSAQNSIPIAMFSCPPQVAGIEDREGLQPAVLQRQQQVGTWTINHVSKPSAVTGQERIGIALGVHAEVANVGRKRIVLSKGGVELQLRQRLILQLCPTSYGVQRQHDGGRIGERPVIDDAAAKGSAEPANSLSTVEEAAQA